jgi:heme/copper-type cytochrome/quinol oxidase subunit 3
MWIFLASEAAIFGGLIVIYSLLRLRHPEWASQSKHTLTDAGAINTAVLLTSSLTVVLAHREASVGRCDRAARLLSMTVLLGLLFLGIKTFEYAHEVAAGFTPVANLFWSFYFLMTGLHAAHVLAGMIAIAVVALAVRRGKHLARTEYVGMYWHFVDIVWIFLVPLLYLAS